MEEEIITIYCLCKEMVRALGVPDDPQGKMTTAEVMTVAVVAARFFGGNIERSHVFRKGYGYIRGMRSKNRLNRRRHAIPREVWVDFFRIWGEIHR